MIHPDKQRVNLLLNSIYLIIFLSFFIQCNRVSNRSTDKSLISADSTKHSSQNSGQTEIINTKTDSLKILLENVKSDTARIHILDELAIAEEDDLIRFGYNRQIEILTQEILSAKLSAKEEKPCKKHYFSLSGV